jgi:hypothetical protein
MELSKHMYSDGQKSVVSLLTRAYGLFSDAVGGSHCTASDYGMINE